jgi:hypothetical protein
MAPGDDTMLYWLIEAARRLRTLQGKKVPDVGFWYGDPSAVYRFEQGKGWPRDVDKMLGAYARELGLEDSREIWRLAIDLYVSEGAAFDLEQLVKPDAPRTQLSPAELLEAARSDFEQALDDARPARPAARQQPARKSSSKATRRAAG